jgi:uncharacterized protein (DUF1684 family)
MRSKTSSAGVFRFGLSGQEFVLQAYKADVEEELLFIPFKDLTSGQETYGAGRYLDLDPVRNRIGDDKRLILRYTK